MGLVNKLLIYGTSYVETQEQRYTFSLWLDTVTRLNPEADVLVVDSNSPALPDTGKAELWQLGNNVGHLGKTGKDGWGRAFCAGLQYAVDEKYRRCVHIECDVLFARPVEEVLARMRRATVRVAAPMANPYQFIETGLMFMDPSYMEYKDLIARYDWEKMTPNVLPEVKIADILKENLFALPLRGLRNDHQMLNPTTMQRMFPYGIDWLTHADAATQRAFLKVNGLG